MPALSVLEKAGAALLLILVVLSLYDEYYDDYEYEYQYDQKGNDACGLV